MWGGRSEAGSVGVCGGGLGFDQGTWRAGDPQLTHRTPLRAPRRRHETTLRVFARKLYKLLVKQKEEEEKEKTDMSAAQGLLSSVFSCSLSPKTIAKRRLRQTISLDPALMRHFGSEAAESSYKVSGGDPGASRHPDRPQKTLSWLVLFINFCATTVRLSDFDGGHI